MSVPPEVNRIQSFLRGSAHRQYLAEAVPPFTLFFHPADTNPYFNYAIPNHPLVSGDFEPAQILQALRQLQSKYQQRDLIPRFEFFERYAPALPDLLTTCGFQLESRNWSMLCPAFELQPAIVVPDLDIVRLDGSSPDADLIDFITAQRQGFDPENLELPSPQAIQNSRHDLGEGGWTAYLGRVAGEPAGVAVFSRPLDGVSEVAGVATRTAFRRRGIASCLTYHCTAEAFACGAQTACLTAADERAGRVYERLGYRALSEMVSYRSE